MNKNQIELEIILTSTYCNVIMDVLKNHKSLSVNKMLVFSYLIKKRKYLNSSIYYTSNKKDVTLKGLSQLTGLFDDYLDNIKYIIRAIHLLVTKEKIIHNSGELIYIEIGEVYIKEPTFIDNVIRDSQKYSDRQFLKEVISNV